MEKELKLTLTTTSVDSHKPGDTVSAIEWYPGIANTPLFCCSSWDSTLNFYTENDDGFLGLFERVKLPSIATNIRWYEEKIYSGSPDGSVNIFDVEKEQSLKLGSHKDIVLKFSYTSKKNTLLSASADGQFYLWDLRDKNMISEIKLPSRIDSIDFDPENDHVGYVSDEYFRACHLKNLFVPNLHTEALWSNDKVRSRSLALSKTSAAIGTVYGEIMILNKNGSTDISLNPPQNQQVKRNLMNKNFLATNINCIDINKTSEYYYLLGGNNLLLYNHSINITKKVETNSHVTACKYSPDGKYVAFATGEDYSLGQFETKTPSTEIFMF